MNHVVTMMNFSILKRVLVGVSLAVMLVAGPLFEVEGQRNKEDLLHLIAKNSADTIRLRAYITLADDRLFVSSDSAYTFYREALTILENRTVQHALGEDSLARLMVKIDRSIGITFSVVGNNDSSLYYFNKSLKGSESLKDTLDMVKNYNNIAVTLNNFGQYQKSLDFYLKGLNLSEKLGNPMLIANFCNNISVFYNDGNNVAMMDLDKALFYRKLSLQTSLELKDDQQIANNYANIGSLFGTINDDSSLHYARLAIPLYEKVNDLRGLSVCYSNIGFQYRKMEKYTEALTNFQKSKSLAMQVGDKQKISATETSMAELYYMIALKNEGAIRNEYAQQAINNAKNALSIATEINSITNISGAASALANIYELIGDYPNAYNNLKLFDKMDDSLKSKELVEATYRTENKFILERNDLLLKEKSINEELAQHRKMIIIIVLVAALALCILLVLLFLRMRLVKRQNVVISEQKQLVDSQNIMLSQKNEEIVTQKEEIETQRDFVFKQREEMISSINYARRIQEAILPKIPQINDSSSFVLFLPKDIVSGDFYWFSQSKGKLMIAVADCTGHGVPGAFMSMLGLSYMREIAGFHFDDTPANMLNLVRKMIIEALKQNGTPFEQRDGMDMSLCILDLTTNVLQFSAAYNTIFVVPHSGDPYSIKGDLQPIAFHYKMTSFTNHELHLNRGDSFYLMSDGMKDQLNMKGKKFTYKRLTEMLVSINSLPMTEQRVILKNAIEEWRCDEKQIDDITVLGYKI